ncbi:uncharacterized protein OCT59_012970 [Rhizophagus irregularis]|uniref:uncharacterized protein n=1 Tax=Rhizophagus irregularis TaxID=588596 RepID=UPI00332BACD8|nr:hypothetical protein OCT59_012970 [Rhizophagus irregularis]
MEIINTNDKNSFDPTPRLKSSPIPIKFISFNWRDINCIYCGEKYIDTLFVSQKYCKKCLSRYINDMTNNNIYLDVYITTMDLECSEHEISRTNVPQSIGNCSLYQGTGTDYYRLKLCSDCYLISSGSIESTFVKKKISIFYLPWWYNDPLCDICYLELTFTSDCQKYCENCYIFYVGCRYCLTTNIIFGPTDQSQCKKCKRISPINSNFDDFLFNNNLIICDNLDYLKLAEFENIVKNINKYYVQSEIIRSIFKEKKQVKQNSNKWIPYSQFKDVKEMTKGGYGTIYKATWFKYGTHWLNKNETVILKRFENSKNNGKYFLNELKSCNHCFEDKTGYIIETYGFAKDPELEDYILVMKYALGGDLHKHLQNNFASITWDEGKLRILYQISKGWTYERVNEEEFSQAEAKRAKLIESKKIGPEFAEKRHLGAIYTSRPLSALISDCSSTYSFSTISFGKRDSNYISELENNKGTESLSLQNLNSNYISEELELDIDIERYISEELKLDINTERSQNLSSTIQNFSTSLKKRSNVEFLNVAPHNNSGKRIKTNFNYP